MILDSTLQKSFDELGGKYALRGLLLYGSMVHSAERAEDADVIYFSIEKLKQRAQYELIEVISDLLQKDKVDLVYWNDAYPLLKNEVALKNQLLFGDYEWIQIYLRAGQREYWDALPHYNALDEKLKQQLHVAR